MDPGTPYYYTFTTIAQTLAGVIALLGAFALFRLGRIDEAVEAGLALLRRYNQSAPLGETWPIVQEGGYEGLMESKYGKTFDDLKGNEVARHTLNTATAADPAHRHVIVCLWATLATAIIDICLCLVALPLVPHLPGSSWGPSLMWSAVILAVVSLVFSGFLVGALARRRPV